MNKVERYEKHVELVRIVNPSYSITLEEWEKLVKKSEKDMQE